MSDPRRRRVDSGDWDAITAAVNDHGGALLPRLLTSAEAARLRKLYANNELFRATVDMERHRYGAGQYRYLRAPYPEPIEALKQALYPRLLPIAREWWAKLRRATRGRRPSTSGWTCVMPPAKPSPPPCC